jgi:hypothetical protein
MQSWRELNRLHTFNGIAHPLHFDGAKKKTPGRSRGRREGKGLVSGLLELAGAFFMGLIFVQWTSNKI